MSESFPWAASFAAWRETVFTSLKESAAGGELTARHPFITDGGLRCLDVTAGATSNVSGAGEEFDLQDALALWRFAPQNAVASGGTDARWFPLDAAMPAEPVWEAADLAARRTAREVAGGPEALLSIVLGPVQPFIAAARSLRDLWTGSALLSWLAFKAIEPVLEQHGPTAMVFPVLRGNPLMDQWLQHKGVEIQPEQIQPGMSGSLRTPGLPHRLLAAVPSGADGAAARDLARLCETSAQSALRYLSEKVRQALDQKLAGCDLRAERRWDARWERQIAAMLSVTATVVPLDTEAARLAQLTGRTPESRATLRAKCDQVGLERVPRSLREALDGDWPGQLDLVMRVAETTRSVRPIPPPEALSEAPQPPKCSLLGTWEQMGPAAPAQSRQFWDCVRENLVIDGVRLRARERLCAQSLVKRFAMPVGLGEALGLSREDMKFPDTATVAAGDWLNEVGLDWASVQNQNGQPWNGQWLYRDADSITPEEYPSEAVQKKIDAAHETARAKGLGEPPSYYAVMLCDGDNMSDWLRGETAPHLRAALADSDLAEHLGDDIPAPIGPMWQALLSQALASFTTVLAPRIVAKHNGTLIYAGGDDVLAVMPVRRALACARELRAAFRGEIGSTNVSAHEGWFRFEDDPLEAEHLTLGPRAGLSAGICLAHLKTDLREVLDAARRAERAAKDAGRDSLAIQALRRSGEPTQAVAGWDDVAWLNPLLLAFTEGVSDRWTYHLRALAPTLSALPDAAAKAELRRQINRLETVDRKKLAATLQDLHIQPEGESVGHRVEALYAGFNETRGKRCGSGSEGSLNDFVKLCQIASFMARGRDR